MNYDQFYFVIFMINAIANFYNIGTCEVYKILTRTGAINNYLVKHYDVLSTLGREYLINDLREPLISEHFKNLFLKMRTFRGFLRGIPRITELLEVPLSEYVERRGEKFMKEQKI